MGSSLPGNTWKWMVNAGNQRSICKLYRNQTEGCPGLRRGIVLCTAETWSLCPFFSPLFGAPATSCVLPWASVSLLVNWRPWANRWSLACDLAPPLLLIPIFSSASWFLFFSCTSNLWRSPRILTQIFLMGNRSSKQFPNRKKSVVDDTV